MGEKLEMLSGRLQEGKRELVLIDPKDRPSAENARKIKDFCTRL